MNLNHCLLLLLFLFRCFALDNPEFERSQFPSRSGDIIIVPASIQDDSFMVLLDSNNFDKVKEGQKVEETNVVNLISSLVGGPIVNSDVLDETVISSGHNLFNKAKANLLVFIDSVGSDALMSLPSLKISKEHAQRLAIKRVAYPQDSVATLTTLMTGHTPSIHGIVSKSWESKQGKQIAYLEETIPRIFNLNDRITQTFEGRTLQIAASADFQMASAMGVNFRSTIENNFVLYWNDQLGQFENVFYGFTFGLNLTKAQLASKIENGAYKGFDVNSKEDFLFVAELEFLRNMATVIAHNKRFTSLVNDRVPDLFSFSFSSLKNLAPNKLATAIALLDETLVEVMAQLSSVYSGKLSTEIIFSGTSAQQKLARDQQLKDRVLALLKDNVNEASFDEHFPSIYLREGVNQQTICQRVREEINVEVVCPNRNSPIPTISAYVEQVTDTPTDYNEAATTFQTVLWMSVIMAIFVYGAVYSMYSLDLPADSILYRTPKAHTQ